MLGFMGQLVDLELTMVRSGDQLPEICVSWRGC